MASFKILNVIIKIKSKLFNSELINSKIFWHTDKHEEGDRESEREREGERTEKVPDFVVAANSFSMRGKYAVKCIEMSCP